MKNWEKYEKEIKELGLNKFTMKRNTDKVCECGSINCSECKFNIPQTNCRVEVGKWLYEDYRDSEPILTKEEFILLNSLAHPEGMDIYRNKEGDVYLSTYVIAVGLKKDMFSFIAPGLKYAVPDLKKIKVEEGE